MQLTTFHQAGAGELGTFRSGALVAQKPKEIALWGQFSASPGSLGLGKVSE